MAFGFSGLPSAKSSDHMEKGFANVDNIDHSRLGDTADEAGNTSAQLSPGSLKRTHTESNCAEDCQMGYKRQRSGDDKTITDCCMSSVTISKLKSSDSISQEEIGASFKHCEIDAKQSADQKKPTSWDRVDEGTCWATKTGKLHGPWNFKVFSWEDVEGGKGPNKCECDNCKFQARMETFIPKFPSCGCGGGD